MTTRAEEIAAEGPYSKFGDPKIGRWYVLCDPDPYVLELDERQIDARVIALNAAFIKGYKQGQQDRWIPITEQIPDGNVWLSGYAYNDPANEDFWQKPGYYHGGILHANDEFDPWDGYPPTHWMPAPAPPSPHNPEQP